MGKVGAVGSDSSAAQVAAQREAERKAREAAAKAAADRAAAAAAKAAAARNQQAVHSRSTFSPAVGGPAAHYKPHGPSSTPPGTRNTLDPNDPKVKQANADYNAKVKNQPYTQALPLLKAHANDPTYQAQMALQMREGVPGVDQLQALVSGPQGALTQYEGGGYKNQAFKQDDRTAVQNLVQNGYALGGIDAQYIRAQAGGKNPVPAAVNADAQRTWTKIGTDLAIPQVGLNPANDPAVTRLTVAETKFHTAQAVTKDLDKTLQAELHQLGPSISKAEQNAYMKAFQQTHGQDYADLFKSAEELNALLKGPDKAALLDAMVRDPSVAQNAFSDYKNLAQIPSTAKDASAFADQVWTLGDTPLKQSFWKFNKSFSSDIKYPAAINAAIASAASGQSDPNAVSKAIDNITWYNQNAQGWEAAPIDGLKAYAEKLKTATASAEKGNYQALEQLTAESKGFGRVGTALRTVGLAFGAIGATSAVAQQDYANAIASSGSAVSDGLEVASPLLKGWATVANEAKAGELNPALRFLANNHELIGKVAGGVGAAGGLVADVLSIQNGNDTFGAKAAVAGDIVMCVASAAAQFAVPFAGEAAAVGAAITFAGNLYQMKEQTDRRKSEMVDLLQKSNVTDQALANKLVNADPAQLQKMGGLKLTPLDIKALVNQAPEIAGSLSQLDNMAALQKRGNLDGETVYRMLNAVINVKADNAHDYRGSSPVSRFLRSINSLSNDPKTNVHDFLDRNANMQVDRHTRELYAAARDALATLPPQDKTRARVGGPS